MAGRDTIIISLVVLLCIATVSAQSTDLGLSSNWQAKRGGDTLNTVLALPLHFGVDKGQHFMGSLITTVFVFKVLEKRSGWSRKTTRGAAIGFTVSVGVLKECIDRRRPGNRFSWRDLLADAAGIGVGLVLINQR